MPLYAHTHFALSRFVLQEMARAAKQMRKEKRRRSCEAAENGRAGFCLLACARSMHRLKALEQAAILLPCKHVVVCSTCVPALRRLQWRCPLCREHVSEAWRTNGKGVHLERVCLATDAPATRDARESPDALGLALDAASEAEEEEERQRVQALRQRRQARAAERRAQRDQQELALELASQQRSDSLRAWLGQHNASVCEAFASLSGSRYICDCDVEACMGAAGVWMQPLMDDWTDGVHKVSLRRVVRAYITEWA